MVQPLSNSLRERVVAASAAGEKRMSFKGSWTIHLNAPLGVPTFTLEADVDGDRLTGVVSNGEDTREVLNGKVEGDEASWDLPINKPIPLTLGFSAMLDGNEISGLARLGALGSAKFTGARNN